MEQTQTTSEKALHDKLIHLSTKDLLAKFGKGGHKPGSGSAAALLALLSCKLSNTVVQVTERKPDYLDNMAQLTLASNLITENCEPRLVDLFEKDSAEFDKVMQLRLARNKEEKGSKERAALNEKHLKQLEVATALPLEIAEISNEVAEKAITVFDLGVPWTRGDSVVAMSSAIAGATGAAGVVYLNLTYFRDSAWATSTREKIDAIAERTAELQEQMLQKLFDLQVEVLSKQGIERAPEVPCDKCSGTGKLPIQ
jgi:formiminotetrahydrofolate cyclodeaminase